MKTRLAALLLCALPHLAFAQMVYGPATITSGTISSTVRVTPNGQAETSLGAALAAGAGACPTSGCTFTGTVNTTSTSGYQQNGATVLNQTNIAQGSLVAGSGAGSALPAGSIFSTFLGWHAGNAFTGATGEATCVGTIACPFLVDGNFNSAFGEHALGMDVHGSSNSAFGNDAMRDYYNTSGNNTALGKNTLYGGSGAGNTAGGAFALMGNASTMTFAGTGTNGDVLTVLFTGSFPGSPQTQAITFTAGQTPTQMATAFIALVNANPAIQSIAFTATNATSLGATVAFNFQGTASAGSSIVVSTQSLTGAATETVSYTGGATGSDNTAFGFQAMKGDFSLTTASQNSAFGRNSLQLVTSGSSNSGFGWNSLLNETTGSNNSCFGISACQGAAAGATGNFNSAFGVNTLLSLTSGGGNTVFGRDSGNKITGGGSNLIGGLLVASTTLTTGNNNILLGTSSATDTVASNTSNEINVAGLLFWNSNSLAAPAVSACGTSPSIDAHANNRSGTVTVGTATPASCTVTFAGTGYTTWNHCRVTPGTTLATFAVSYTKTVLTITGTALSGNIDYDCDGV